MFGYLITALAGIFWIFRVVVALMHTAGVEFIITPINMIFEVILLFITFPCIILIGKRKMVAAVLYLIAQGTYFGIDAYMNLTKIVEGNVEGLSYLPLLISTIAMIIPILAILDIGTSSGKGPKNEKTDWFYNTDDYERKFDDRADKNQYKF